MAKAVEFEANGRTYRTPSVPVAVLCLDGFSNETLDAALEHRVMPRMAAMIEGGFRTTARGALPSFTNVNNAAMITGVPPSVTGISGNFFLDPDTGVAVKMTSPKYLRCETLLAAASRAGRRVAVVTAKDKLRALLATGLVGGIAFSGEKAAEAEVATHGIDDVPGTLGRPAPDIYSAEASAFVLAAGASLVEQGRADFLFLSTTDYVQHRYAPHAPEALTFCAALDVELGRLLDAGTRVGITADHGMSAKTDADGNPNVVYLETRLRAEFGACMRVICPITDPYVAHHGALGSLVMVHAEPGVDLDAVARFVLALPGIDEVYPRSEAAALELPADRIGDLVVLAEHDVALGRTEADHDLSQLHGALRTHGGRHEVDVPLLLSQPLRGASRARALQDPRNFDVFDLTCNG
ncbi:MAG: phosphonoacetate hydrolase [Myxococcota bacterium]